jgi:hypothetical protein
LAFGSSIASLQFFEGEIEHFEPGTVRRITFKEENNNTYIDNDEIVRFDWIYSI